MKKKHEPEAPKAASSSEKCNINSRPEIVIVGSKGLAEPRGRGITRVSRAKGRVLRGFIYP